MGVVIGMINISVLLLYVGLIAWLSFGVGGGLIFWVIFGRGGKQDALLNVDDAPLLNHVVIGGNRRCGKTSQLVIESHKEWKYILCVDDKRRSVIMQTARYLDLDILYPVTVSEVLSQNPIKEFLVDDVEAVLEAFTHAEILTMSTSYDLEVMSPISELEGKLNESSN